VRHGRDDLSRLTSFIITVGSLSRADAESSGVRRKADRTISAARVTAVFALPVGVAAGRFRVSYPSLKYKKFKAYTVLFQA